VLTCSGDNFLVLNFVDSWFCSCAIEDNYCDVLMGNCMPLLIVGIVAERNFISGRSSISWSLPN